MLAATLLDCFVRLRLGLLTPGPQGAIWIHPWCKRILWAIGVEYSVSGPLPDLEAGKLALVSNHLSYLDVLLYSAARPFIMVSKMQVRYWPFFGWLTAQCGTVYVQRSDFKGGQTQTHSDVNRLMAEAYRSGLPVLFFPEGTTTEGAQIGEFRRGLFPSLLENEVPLKAAAVRFEFTQPNPGATIAEDVCFIGDASLGPHLLGLIGLKGVKARIQFGDETVAGKDAAELAHNSREQVISIFDRLSADEMAAKAKSVEDVFDRPVDGLGSIYRDGGASR